MATRLAFDFAAVGPLVRFGTAGVLLAVTVKLLRWVGRSAYTGLCSSDWGFFAYR